MVPDFLSWSLESCVVVPPEEFGGVIALRDGTGDLQVLNPELWEQRVTSSLSKPGKRTLRGGESGQLIPGRRR